MHGASSTCFGLSTCCTATPCAASHMETRALGLLRKLHAASKAPAGGPKGKGPGGKVGFKTQGPKAPKQPSNNLPRAGSTGLGEGGPGGDREARERSVGAGGPGAGPDARAESGAGAGPSGRPAEGGPAGGAAGGPHGSKKGKPGNIKPGSADGPGTGSKRKAGEGGGSGKPDTPTGQRNPLPPPKKQKGEAGSAGKDKADRPSSSEPKKKKAAAGGAGADKAGGGKGEAAGAGTMDLLAPVMSDIKAWRKLKDDDSLDNKEVARRMMACLQVGGGLQQLWLQACQVQGVPEGGT